MIKIGQFKLFTDRNNGKDVFIIEGNILQDDNGMVTLYASPPIPSEGIDAPFPGRRRVLLVLSTPSNDD